MHNPSLKFFALLTVLSLIWACTGEQKQTTPKGYEYVYHKDAETPVVQSNEYVYFNVVMRSGDSVISSTYNSNQTPRFKLPSEEQLANNKSPIVDALSVLSPGDSVTLYFPVDSMNNTPPGMSSGDVMEYDIAVEKVLSAEEYKQEQQVEQQKLEAQKQELLKRLPEIESTLSDLLTQYNEGTIEALEQTDSGLEYMILEEGKGQSAASGKNVSVHYYGSLMSADTLSAFDNSFKRGEPITFPLGQGRVIRGWDEGIALLKEGSRAVLFIPSELGYGKQGSPPAIPADADLMFYVELKEVK